MLVLVLVALAKALRETRLTIGVITPWLAAGSKGGQGGVESRALF